MKIIAGQRCFCRCTAWLALFFWLFMVALLSACSSGGGGDEPAADGDDDSVADTVAPTAVLSVTDAAGVPLSNGRIAYGDDFILSGEGSTDAGGGSVVSYRWTAATAPVGPFANGGTVTSANDRLTVDASTTPVPEGDQIYRLVVEDDSGNLSTPEEVQVTVFAPNEPPLAVMTLSRVSGFAPLTVNFDGSGSSDSDGTIVSYAWDFGDGSVASTEAVTHTYITPGSYSVGLTVTDDGAAVGGVDPRPQVEVLAAPVVTITPATASVDPGGTQQFSASVTGTSNGAVSWHLVDSGCGTLDADGLFSAGSPASSCSNTVQAVSLADNRVSAMATVSVATCTNATFSVNETSDVADINPGDKICDDGNGRCTLRAAVDEANACRGANTINLPAGTYLLRLGQLTITDELAINGAGAAATIIDGNDADRIFGVAPNLAAVALSDLTLANGLVSNRGPALYLGGNTPMRVERTVIRDNVADYWGCAVNLAQNAELVLIDSSILRNRCDGTNPGGSAIMMDAGVDLTIRASTIAYNGPAGGGNGVIMEWSHGENPISVSIENSTIVGNQGTAIKATNWVTVDIKNSTITNNDEGIRVESGHGGASIVNIGNSILYANARNCFINSGTLASTGHNIDSRSSCGFTATGDQTNTDPKLGALVDNGGATQTRGLLAGSPALNAADNGDCLVSDQTGSLRDDGQCDIGAYEGEVAQVSCIGSPLLVTSTLDAVDANMGDGVCDDGNGNCTLRAAVQEANACIGHDVIDLAAGIYLLTQGGSGEDAAASGDVDISDNLEIRGAGSGSTSVEGGALGDRLFQVLNEATTSFDGLTLKGVDIVSGVAGGAIWSSGDLRISNVVLSGNRAGNGAAIYAANGSSVSVTDSILSFNDGLGSGAAIYVDMNTSLDISGSTLTANTLPYEYGHRGAAVFAGRGARVTINATTIDNNAAGYAQSLWASGGVTLNLTDSTVSNSSTATVGVMGEKDATINIVRSTISGNKGGGVRMQDFESTLTLIDSTVRDNEVHGLGSFRADGAGASIVGLFTISGSTFSGNRIVNGGFGGTGDGAGLYMEGRGTITNSTFSGNVNGGQYGRGGAIAGSGDLTVANATFVNNFTSTGEGDNINFSGLLTLGHSIFADGDCVVGSLVSNEINIDRGSRCASAHDMINTSAKLGPLADNGGPTLTHAPGVGSPAIDGGSESNCPATDQRGFRRPRDGNVDGYSACDIGAVEVQ